MVNVLKTYLVGLVAVLVLLAAGVAFAEDGLPFKQGYTVYAAGESRTFEQGMSKTSAVLVGIGAIKYIEHDVLRNVMIEALTGTAEKRFTTDNCLFYPRGGNCDAGSTYAESGRGAWKIGAGLGFDIAPKVSGFASFDYLEAADVKNTSVAVKIGYTF